MLEDKPAARRKVEKSGKKVNVCEEKGEGYVQIANAWRKERKVKVEIKTSKE